jgi:hypothetical protein
MPILLQRACGLGDRSWRKGPDSIPKDREMLNRMRCLPLPSAKHAILLEELHNREQITSRKVKTSRSRLPDRPKHAHLGIP